MNKKYCSQATRDGFIYCFFLDVKCMNITIIINILIIFIFNITFEFMIMMRTRANRRKEREPDTEAIWFWNGLFFFSQHMYDHLFFFLLQKYDQIFFLFANIWSLILFIIQSNDHLTQAHWTQIYDSYNLSNLKRNQIISKKFVRDL